jgi:hypothetical protein
MLDDAEKVRILLAEYSSLRTEIIGRITNLYQVVGFGSVLAALILQQEFQGNKFWSLFVVLIAGILISGRFLAFDMRRSAKRVRELEKEINMRSGEKLLVWESELGGLNASYWRELLFLGRSRR